jgi:hypothetical protein
MIGPIGKKGVKITLEQVGKLKSYLSKQKKASTLGFKMPEKKGWKKPLFPKSKMFPEYSPYDVATDLGATAVVLGGYAGYKKLTKKDKDKKKKENY